MQILSQHCYYLKCFSIGSCFSCNLLPILCPPQLFPQLGPQIQQWNKKLPKEGNEQVIIYTDNVHLKDKKK